MSNQLSKKLGQNTAEYLIMLVLVAVGSIGIFTIFGDTVRKQLNNVVSALTGSTDTMYSSDDLKQQNAEKARDRADKGISMGGISPEEIKSHSE